MAGPVSQDAEIEEKTFRAIGIPFPLSPLFSRESMEKALLFNPQPNDVILSSYPKSDSKVVDSLVWKLLYLDLKHPPLCTTNNRFLPCLEMTSSEDLTPMYDVMTKYKMPRLYKSYLPHKLLPKYHLAKYIYVMRMPWETCASYYTFLCLNGVITKSFDEFFDDFLEGKVPCGSYFKHIGSWNKRMQQSNLLILSREHVENNPRGAMFQIAAFLGDAYLRQLIDNKEVADNILNSVDSEDVIESRNKRKSDYIPNTCSAHISIKCMKYQCEGLILRSNLKPTCSESQMKSMTEAVSSRFKDSGIEHLWLNLLKKQTLIITL